MPKITQVIAVRPRWFDTAAVAVVAAGIAMGAASQAKAAISASSQTVERYDPIEERGTQKAKWPKIHKCKPINKGIECEIKMSDLPLVLADTTNEQSATATATYKDGKWSYGVSGTASQTNSKGSNSNTNSVTVTHDSKQGTSVSGTSSNKSSR